MYGIKKRGKANHQSDFKLDNASRVAVIGGGPAGSLFSYFLLRTARKIGKEISVEIYEPRDFNTPGPAGCNMCAGVISETLVQYLAAEGINLPPIVVERGIDSYVLQMDVGSVRIDTALHEKRIGAVHRGIGPRDLREIKWHSFDNHLLTLAIDSGARVVRQRVVGVGQDGHQIWLKAFNEAPVVYDLLVVAVGVNTAALKLFEGLGFGFEPPRTTKCYLREYYLGEQSVEKYVGSSMHAFLLNIPRLEFAAVVPKGDYVALSLLGEEIDRDLIQTLVNDPALKRCLPPDFPMDQAACWCTPRINVKGSSRPYGDRIVFIGDCGVTRLYKDGLGAAYRTAKAAAATVLFQGTSVDHFRRYYWPVCRKLEADNFIGKIIFTTVRQIQRKRFARLAILNMVTAEQQNHFSARWGMSLVLWDMFTGSASYGDIFLRTLHPAFWTRYLRHLIAALWSVTRDKILNTHQATGAPHPGHRPHNQ